MNHMSATDITLIITTLSTALVSVIAAWKANSNANISKSNSDKLDTASDKLDRVDNKATIIHDLSNGNLQKLKADLDEERRRNSQLNSIVLEIINLLPAGTADKLVTRMHSGEVDLINQLRSKE